MISCQIHRVTNPGESGVPERKEKILVVDDESAVRGSIRAYLEDEGYQVAEADSGRAALQLFEELRPDLILIDLRMPGMDGLEVLARLRESTPDTPVIVISGAGVIGDVVRALRLGACNYLLKPIQDLGVLGSAIEKAMGRARMLHERRRHQEELEEMVAQRTEQLRLHQEHLEELVDERTRELQQEIAERRLAEASLRASEERFRDFAESASDWFWEMDAELRFNYVSERLYQIEGMKPVGLLGRTRREIAGEAAIAREPEKWRRHLEQLERHEPFRNFEYTLEGGEGFAFHVQLSGNPVFDEKGEFKGYRGTGRDISDLRSTQAKLVQSEKMAALGFLNAAAAPEINTPVGIGVTASSHLDECIHRFEGLYRAGQATEADLEELLDDVREAGKVIHSNLQRAVELIQSFKQVAVDQSTQERRRFDLKRYLEEILLSLRPRLRQSRIRIELRCPESLHLDSYPGALSQVVTNLVMNSLVHGFPGGGEGVISIDAQKTPNGILIVYADNGQGMTEEQVSRVFEPFYTTRRGGGGSGLGMHIVYNLVTEKLGGSIECESKSGQGVSYRLTLP